MSAFEERAVCQSLDDAAGFLADLDEALERTGGPMTPEEEAWADAVGSGKYTTETMPEFPRSPGRTSCPPDARYR